MLSQINTREHILNAHLLLITILELIELLPRIISRLLLPGLRLQFFIQYGLSLGLSLRLPLLQFFVFYFLALIDQVLKLLVVTAQATSRSRHERLGCGDESSSIGCLTVRTLLREGAC